MNVNDLDPDRLFPFPLDAFQQDALAAINQGKSLVVSAPTGSGKTLIGEYAIHRALAQGRRVFYTTPLKALSNQKLRDFRQQFGPKRVGLLTGDLSLNREAPVVVMTTEIFRNMLYGQSELDDPLAGVEAVVLDECHYMNDSQRGTVWEESIIHCPVSVQLLALSATVANGDQLTDWIQQVHGPCALIHSVHRPVPLSYGFCSAKGLHPLLNDSGDNLHPDCKVWRPPKGHRRRGRTPKPPQPEPPRLTFVVQQLAERDMLPAIVFIFSRRGCDRGVAELARMNLLTAAQQQRLAARLDQFRQQMPDGVRGDGHADALLRGIASHHAGVLPAWKELVEELFQAGLLKVVLATETLAAGINMPARSTVICTLSKRTEMGHRPLMASEFLQMAGRAGRRGLDQRGHVVTVQSRFEGVREAGQLATSPADPLVSQFTPSYSMVLNLLQRYSLSQAQELVERSFGRYLASLGLVDEQQAIAQLAAQVETMDQDLASVPWNDLDSYEKERAKLREEHRLLRTLRQQAAETVAHELTLALQFASQGTIVTVKSPHLEISPAAAVLVEKRPGPGQFPLLLCLTEGNVWLLLPCRDVVAFHGELSCLAVATTMAMPPLRQAGERRHGDGSSQGLSLSVAAMAQRHDLRTARYDLAAEVQDQAQRVAVQEKQLGGHPAHAWRDRKRLRQKRYRLETVKQELEDRRRQLNDSIGRHWRMVLSLIDILRHFACLQELRITPAGCVVSALRGDNELWLGLALLSGHLDTLPAAELAATMEAISTEVSRNDLWSAYPPPPLVMDALTSLRDLGRELDRQQQHHGIATPIWWEPDLTGLVAAWARGSSWDGLMAKTSLDEGDVVRVLRRTMDVLAQIPHCPGLKEPLRRNARRAHAALNRFPVREADAIAADPSPIPDITPVDSGSTGGFG